MPNTFYSVSQGIYDSLLTLLIAIFPFSVYIEREDGGPLRCEFQFMGFSQRHLWRVWVQSTAHSCEEMDSHSKKRNLIEAVFQQYVTLK